MQSSTPRPARGMPCATATSKKAGGRRCHTLVLAARDGLTNDGSNRSRDNSGWKEILLLRRDFNASLAMLGRDADKLAMVDRTQTSPDHATGRDLAPPAATGV